MGNFKITQVDVSPEAQLYSFQNDDSSDIETQPEKMTRADYAVKESPDKQKEVRYQSFTEKAQNFLRDQSEDSDINAYSGGESTQTSEDVDPCVEKVQIKEKEKLRIVNEFGDDFTELVWDGPEDSDEEIEELLPFKTDFERK